MTTIVVLPGMDGTGLALGPFSSALGSEFNVNIIRYPTDQPLGYPELEVIARAALPEQGPYLILGESFSGPLAVSLAASDSTRLRGLILCASFVRNPRPSLAWLKPLVRVLPLKVVPMALMSYLLLGRECSAALRRALSEALATIAPETLRARLLAVLAVDAARKLAALDLPILYLRAARDRVVPRGASELVSQLNPRARIVRIDAPHFLLQTAPNEAARAIREFVHKASGQA